MIKVVSLNKSFGDVRVLCDVSLEIGRGEVVAVVGASGAGKTTLLQIIGSLLEPSSGEVEIGGKNVFALKGKQLAAFRNRNIGFVFQFHQLLPEFTALENVMMPALIGGVSRSEAMHRAQELLQMVGMEQRMDHKPAQLSGGEQQRVAIARAMINYPSVILADEPTGNLDSRNRDEIQQLLMRLRKEYGQTIVMVTHDEHLAQGADRIIELKDGRVL